MAQGCWGFQQIYRELSHDSGHILEPRASFRLGPIHLSTGIVSKGRGLLGPGLLEIPPELPPIPVSQIAGVRGNTAESASITLYLFIFIFKIYLY